MKDTLISFNEVAMDCQSGITELQCDALGLVTYVGFSREGDVVVQSSNDGITAIPELEWNLMKFNIPFQDETHVRYICQKDLEMLNEGVENFLHIDLALRDGMMYPYEVTMNIRRVYK